MTSDPDMSERTGDDSEKADRQPTETDIVYLQGENATSAESTSCFLLRPAKNIGEKKP